uniref:Putative basic tail protein n=1 Tax=Rhipicephalus pulchellus TaxID=72859 RepID=L7LQ06_RHIPC
MLAIALSALLLPQVLAESYVEEGECNGTVTNPGKPVRNCNFWCYIDNDWENKYFPENTTCRYDETRDGICVSTGDGKTGCMPNESLDVYQPHNEGTEQNNVEEYTTKRPRRNRKNKNKKPKDNSTSTIKPTKKSKDKTKQTRSPSVAQW